jgi:hypothetical protein
MCANGAHPGVLAVITGTGRGTHLGAVVLGGSTCVTFTAADAGFANGDGSLRSSRPVPGVAITLPPRSGRSPTDRLSRTTQTRNSRSTAAR